MAQIELDALERLDIQAWRAEDEHGDVTLIIKTDDGIVRIRIGRTADDADRLAEALSKASMQAMAVGEDWDERPDEHDNYVSWHDGRWYVTYSGSITPAGQPRNGYPGKDVAIYELAVLMAEHGEFGASWVEGADNCPVGIDDEVRAFHDEGGDQMRPLEDVVYEPGDEVRWDDSTWEVRRDYGELGVWLVIPVDPDAGRDHLVPHELTERADLLSEARGWAADCEWIEDAADIADMTDAQVKRGIEAHYVGGWAQFVRDSG